MKFYLSLLIIFYSLFSFSQENNEADTFIIIKGDSIMKNSIELNEISLLPRIKFNDRDKLRQYLILKRKTLKVYPYAKLASVRLESLYERVNGIKRKRNRKRYIKLTQTEGQILIKLINRHTEFTVYEVIKDLKNGFNAFLFNTTAKIFNMSLKETYSPTEVIEDYYIEDILQKAFQSGSLEPLAPKNDIPDLFYLKKLWSTKSSMLKQ